MTDLKLDGATVLLGDCIQRLSELPDCSVQMCVTSPPYFGLRDYGVDGQIGLEQTPDAYIAKMVEVFRAVRRVLADDGTLWLNIGDSYAANRGSGNSGIGAKQATNVGANLGKLAVPPGLKAKDLIGVPWMLAFALRADGWYLRQDIIWHKPNPMPESVRDRCTKAHEYIFLLSKGPRYYYDAKAIEEPAKWERWGNQTENKQHQGTSGHLGGKTLSELPIRDKKNKRSVWTVATRPYKGAHFATFPTTLIEPCILAGTSERGHCPKCGARWERVIERRGAESTGAQIGGDPARQDGGTRERAPAGSGGGNVLAARLIATDEWRPSCDCGLDPVPDVVLDPFNGSGTTGQVAIEHGRGYVGVELNPDYMDLTRQRLERVIEAITEARTAHEPVPQFDLFSGDAA